MEACAVICRKATVALPDANFPTSRAQNRGFCAHLLNWMSGLGRFPAERGIVAPAEPILPLTLPPLHLRSRRICAAAVPSADVPAAVACSRLPPVLPLLAPLHLRSRRTCGAAAPAQPLHLRSRCTCAAAVPAAVACRSSLPPSHLTARAG